MPKWLIPIIFIAFFVLVITLAIIGAIVRRKKIVAALTEAGFDVLAKPTSAEKFDAFSEIATPSHWKVGDSGIQWIARGTVNGVPILLIEHMYSTGAGKSRQVHYHTLAAITKMSGLPSLLVRERTLGDKLASLFGKQSVPLGDEVFDKKFRLDADDHDVAVNFLVPSLRAWLFAQPGQNYAIITGPASLAVYIPRMLAPKDIAALVQKPGEVLAALAANGG